MRQTEGSETLVNHNMTPGKYPEHTQLLSFFKNMTGQKQGDTLSPELFNSITKSDKNGS
jgi:hypothetical protein